MNINLIEFDCTRHRSVVLAKDLSRSITRRWTNRRAHSWRYKMLSTDPKTQLCPVERRTTKPYFVHFQGDKQLSAVGLPNHKDLMMMILSMTSNGCAAINLVQSVKISKTALQMIGTHDQSILGHPFMAAAAWQVLCNL